MASTVDINQERVLGGYNIEFVKQPPSNIQVKCPICLVVLRVPFLVDCCGKNFCETCVHTALKTSQACPTCNSDGFKMMINKGHQQTLNEFTVRCQYSAMGCKWEGNLGQLEEHLNRYPKLEKRLEGCKYTKVLCMYCKKSHDRRNIHAHEATKCNKRPLTCEFCREYTSEYEDVKINHLPKCGHIKATCPHSCGESPLRQDMDYHIKNECPLALISCEYRHVGCEEKIPRKIMEAHMRENVLDHMVMQNRSLSQFNHRLEKENQEIKQNFVAMEEKFSQLDEKFSQLQTENRQLKCDLDVLRRENELLNVKVTELLSAQEGLQQSHEGLCAHVGLQNSSGYTEFTMSHFERHRKLSQAWFSPPFYTHYRGYKMCLKVDPNDLGNYLNTSHVSLYLLLMRGEFDDDLKWPYTGTIEIQLVNQTGEENHLAAVFGMKAGRRVTVENRATSGVSKLGFIARGKLQPLYLKNDCLVFRARHQ